MEYSFLSDKAGRLVLCTEDGIKIKDLLVWTEEDYESYGGMRAIDLDGSYLAVTGSKGVRFYLMD